MDLITSLSYLVLGVLSLGYIFYKFKFTYWKKKGVPQIEPSIPLGNLSANSSVMDLMQAAYNTKSKTCPLVGIYFLYKPAAVATDLDLIRNVLIKDFQYFIDRGVYYNEKDDPLSGHLFSLDGEKWKNLRAKLSPTFTSGKMKFMFPTIVQVASEFQLVLKDIVKDCKENEIEIKELLARFTTDVIGTCAFGIECNSLKDPNAEFRRYGRKIFETPVNNMERILKQQFPDIAKLLHLRNVKKQIEDFFIGVVKETVEFREKNNIRRNDFLDILIELKNGKFENSNLSIPEMAAQVFVFFLAGFETSSTTMSYSLLELALNQDLQDKLRTEINNVLKKHDGLFTYDAMIEMTYLDQVVNETLRKYPPVHTLQRNAIKDYKIPDHDIVIKKQTRVLIPVHAIHHDPTIYPNPEKFDPDRFHPDAVNARHSLSFLTFGDGPRNCIGLRFGKMQTKVGLVMLLNKFKFTAGLKAQAPLKYDKKSPLLAVEGGLWLKIFNVQ